jgi:hypothetical protein
MLFKLLIINVNKSPTDPNGAGNLPGIGSGLALGWPQFPYRAGEKLSLLK